MKNRILLESDCGVTRVAVMEETELVEYYIERDGRCCTVGNVYVGRVQNVLPGMQAAFIDIGTEKNAFLYLGDPQGESGEDFFGGNANSNTRRPLKVRVGQEIMVQVVKEQEGQKGPRVTTRVTVPGCLCVLVTGGEYVGVSRRIEDEAERERLCALAESVRPEGMGIILRTAAREAGREALEREVQALASTWEDICKRGKHATPPKRIHREDALIARAMRDIASCHTEEILVSDERLAQSVRVQLAPGIPGLLERLRVHTGPTPLFEVFGVEEKAERALARKVWLKCGGYLVFDATEALTVVDVNSGKYVGKSGLAQTAFIVNMEAAAEIAKQLRLRDIGGIVVIDFIDMEEEQRREELVEALRSACKCDRNKTNVVGITGLGLVEMTRKKTRPSLAKTLKRPCPVCKGTGSVFAPDAQARQAARELMMKRRSGDEQPYLLEGPAEVIDAFERMGGVEGVKTRAASPCTPAEYSIRALIGEKT